MGSVTAPADRTCSIERGARVACLLYNFRSFIGPRPGTRASRHKIGTRKAELLNADSTLS